jgi:hypothetical protein
MRKDRPLANDRGRFSAATNANHVFVLDFVLFLEYVESPFDDVNVTGFTDVSVRPRIVQNIDRVRGTPSVQIIR